MVENIRNIEKALGQYKKSIENDKDSRKKMRHSIYAFCDIWAGDKITRDVLVCLRPEGGLSPGELENLIGCTAIVDIAKETLITYDMVDEI